MATLCILVSSAVFSTAFWFLGDLLGFEFFTSFLLSGLGAILGCWPGWWVYQRYLR